MGRRGPAPKPTVLKVRAGNPGKRKLNTNEPAPPEPENVEPPPGLSDDAAAEWRELAPQLAGQGLLKSLDLQALMLLCEHTAVWRKAMTQLKKTGLIIKSPNGFLIPNPLLSTVNKQAAIMQRMMAEFGMTPSSRSRIQVTKPNEPSPDEKAAEIIGF